MKAKKYSNSGDDDFKGKFTEATKRNFRYFQPAIGNLFGSVLLLPVIGTSLCIVVTYPECRLIFDYRDRGLKSAISLNGCHKTWKVKGSDFRG